MRDLTITTACDKNYIWGAFLLVASLRRHGTAARIHVLGKDFGPAELAVLQQFEDRRHLVTTKPEAMLSADSEFIAWMDADCMAVGDLGPLLKPPNGELQIRLRARAENAAVYRSLMRPGDAPGAVPEHVLARWRTDVAELAAPRLEASAVTNMIVLHHRHRPFVELWARQMDAVLDPFLAGVVDASRPAYWMTDESVLNSLLSFSSLAPTPGPYRLDLREQAHVAHFGTSPKPWKRWKLRNLFWYEAVLDVLRWCDLRGMRTPPLPWTFRRRYKTPSYAFAAVEHAVLTARHLAGDLVRQARAEGPAL